MAAGRYATDEDDDEYDHGILSALSINVTPGKAKKGPGGGAGGGGKSTNPTGAGPSKRSGRHSVAADSGNGPMTLRDQEQVSDLPLTIQVFQTPM